MLNSELRQVPLHQLRDGADYPLGNINMRHGAKAEDLGPLRASLRENGQLQNIVGSTYQGSDEVYLIIGNRRRMAAQANQDDDPRLSLNNMDVRVYADLAVEQAMEIALSEPMTALPPHEVDQYEAFAALGEKDPRDIAAHFDCSERLVRQRMKLGSLSTKIRDAWREGIIDRATAQAFTLGVDAKAQDKAFEKLRRKSSLQPHSVRAMLVGDQHEVSRLLHFASAEYQAAGGGIVVDLFEEEHAATNPALLKQTADQKLTDLVDFYTAAGWGWAALASDLPAEWEGWPRLRIKPAVPRQDMANDLEQLHVTFARDASPEECRAARVEIQRLENWLLEKGTTEKKRSETGVVIVGVDGDGSLELVLGVTKPEETARVLKDETPQPTSKVTQTERAGKGADPDPAPRLSHKAQTQRAIELTDAAAQVLAKQPRLALIVLLAGISDRGQYGPVRASVAGSGANALRLMDSDSIADNIKRLKAMKAGVLDKLLGQAAAAALIFQAHSAERAAIEDKDTAAVIGLLPAADLQAALKRRFDAENYFGKSLPKELALDAIRENCGQSVFEDQRAVHTAADLRAFALANVKDTWLPPELRTPTYAGPGAKKKTASKKSKKAKRK
jgi:ParB family chromosome partitioning protein